jgi:hypothetical protein
MTLSESKLGFLRAYFARNPGSDSITEHKT